MQSWIVLTVSSKAHGERGRIEICASFCFIYSGQEMVKKIDKRSKIAMLGDCEAGSNPVTPMPRKPLEINGFEGFLLVFWPFI